MAFGPGDYRIFAATTVGAVATKRNTIIICERVLSPGKMVHAVYRTRRPVIFRGVPAFSTWDLRVYSLSAISFSMMSNSANTSPINFSASSDKLNTVYAASFSSRSPAL